MVYCYCDGGCNNATHSDAYGSFAIFTQPNTEPDVLSLVSRFELKSKTSNEAEYDTLIKLLEFIREKELAPAQIYSDSKLVVNQVNGQWTCQADNLKEKLKRARELFVGVSLTWVSRKKIVSVLGH